MSTKTILIIMALVIVVCASVIVYVNIRSRSEMAASQPSPRISPSNATSTAPTGPITLSLGSKSVMVSALQRALINEGYYKGSVTGVYGTSTEAAVEAFQKAKGLAVTGDIIIASSAVTSSLTANASTFVTIGPGASTTEIVAIQKFFMNAGYLKITTATGVYGPATEAAVEAFQKAHGIPQTGIIDKATFAIMNDG